MTSIPDRPHLTAALIRSLARRGLWLEPELAGLPELVRPGDVCVDVGAAAGIYTLTLSDLVGPAGQVHSVEPLSFAHPMWSRLLGARDRPNVRRHRLALSEQPGETALSVPIGRLGPVTGRSFLTWQTDGVGSNDEFRDHLDVLVPVDTLDRLCERAELTRLDFVKIDVEGAELQVLRGGARTIETFGPDLLLEIEARHLTRYRYGVSDVTEWLSSRGYTMHVWHNGWQPATTVCPHGRNYLFQRR
ncbi:MAG TPA: FkbM family methyltransferase [Pseudonocardiaceae bacterium]|jgi:FkbM family methyltransferase|nr:FkbM family methyltransferase [Pseudonocardiaceae bacterium]